jgi:pyruvate kinase
MPHVLQRLPLTQPALSIICTAGPSIYETEVVNGICRIKTSRLRELLEVGMRVVRINFSHVQQRDYEKIRCLISHIRELERETSQPIPILMDLQGPEIRVVEILDRNLKSLPHMRSIRIRQGQKLEVSTPTDAAKPLDRRALNRLVVTFEGDLYPQMVDGETLVMGDNELSLRILEKVAGGVLCLTENRGMLKIKKGLNLPNRGKLEAPILVENDKKSLNEGFDIDLIAQSFVRNHTDVAELQGYLDGTPLRNKPIIAKIETPSAVGDIDAILQIRDIFGVMVARGDLGVLADYTEIPQLQEKLINSANRVGKPVIVATQMLESMVERPRPWRPEVQDISTAIKEGADALMLSEETAIGKFPKETVSVMAAVINKNMPIDDKEYVKKFKGKYAVPNPGRPIDVLGFAICEVANEAGSPFILSYATTGISATLISRFRPKMPVITITNKQDTARKLCLLYNVYPVLVNEKELPREPRKFIKFLREIVAELELSTHIKRGSTASSSVFLVGTQELTKVVIGGGKAQGIFVFEP